MRTQGATVETVLFGQTRGSILALLFGMPDRAFFVREIARRIHTSVGSVQRELTTLAKAALITRSVIGNQVFYCANREYPAFTEIHNLVARTTGIFARLRSALLPLHDRIAFAFVYGSFARGNENAGSDVDLMIIGNVSLDDVLENLGHLEQDLGRPVNPTIYSLEEVTSKLQSKNHFLRSIWKGKKIMLIGDENELGQMG